MSWWHSVKTRIAEWMMGKELGELSAAVLEANSVRGGSYGGGSWLQSERTEDEALESYDRSTILRTCASICAQRLGSWELLWQREDGSKGRDAPQIELWRSPNTEMSGVRFRRVLFSHLLLCDQAMCIMVPSTEANGAGVELLPVPPPDVEREADRSGEIQWRVEYGDMDRLFEPDQILHISKASPSDPWGRPTGTAQVLADELDVERAASDHMANLLTNDARPEAIAFASGVSESGAQTIKTEWQNNFMGAKGRGRVFWSGTPRESGGLQYEPLDHSPADLEMAELTDRKREVVRETFHVSPEIIGHVKDANRATVQAAELIFARSVQQPGLELVAGELNQQLTPYLRGPTGRYVAPETVPANTERRLQAAKAHPGVFYANELRDWVDMPQRDELDGQTLADTRADMLGFGGQPAAGSDGGGGEQSEEGDGTEDTGGEGGKAIELHAGCSHADPSCGAADSDAPAIRVFDVSKSRRTDAERVLERATSRVEFREWFEDAVETTMRTAGVEVAGALGADLPVDALNPHIRPALEQRMSRILPEIDEYTRSQAQAAILRGFEDGGGARQARKQLAEQFDQFSDVRASRIARTETTRATNEASHITQEQSEVVDWRRWMTAVTGVRDAHDRLQGVEKPVDQPFEVDGHTAMFPGDFGVAYLDINCRCTTVPTDGPSDEESGAAVTFELPAACKLASPEQWRDMIDAVRVDRTNKSTETFRDAFAAQKEAALDAFDAIIGAPDG